MTISRRHWTALELELFHDEQLEPILALELSEDLRRDAELRRRLARVRRVDDALRTALLASPRVRTASRIVSVRGSLATASVLLAVSAAGLFVVTRTASRPGSPKQLAEATPAPCVRIIFSLPLSPEQRLSRKDSDARRPSASNESETAFFSHIDHALGASRYDETVELLTSAPPGLRRSGFSYIGERLQSAQIAELILEKFGPADQLAVCSVWASEPAIRPLVFARLRQLSGDPTLAREMGSVLAELSADPVLRAWVLGYRLTKQS